MSERVWFTIPGNPQGKQRPRMTREGHTYTPKETACYENLVRVIYLEKGHPKLHGAIYAKITAVFQPPGSASKKKIRQMLSGELKCMKKPDCDNIAKLVLDALNGFAFDDDRQVVELEVAKRYGETARVEVELTEI